MRSLGVVRLSPGEGEALRALNSVSKMMVAGGWVRDRLLVGASAARLERMRGLMDASGDVDVLLTGSSARRFHESCRSSLVLRSLLRAPATLVPASGERRVDCVKLHLHAFSLDVTGLCGAPLRHDAEARDFTVNAMYFDIDSGEVLDPLERGMADLNDGLIRVAHPEGAVRSVAEDPVRLLRACRFAARYGFRLEDELALASVPSLGPRLLRELLQGLRLENAPGRFLELLGPRLHVLLPGLWPPAPAAVARLELLVLRGLELRLVKGLAPELLLGALLWRAEPELCARLPRATLARVARLQALTRVQAQVPAARLLRCALFTREPPSSFWLRWPRA